VAASTVTGREPLRLFADLLPEQTKLTVNEIRFAFCPFNAQQSFLKRLLLLTRHALR